ncbi:hypothetical protein VNO77_14554 [Canavalia gladiata]|uniref:Uncharacterized protein n=1 Tax=Canavalia gladiata TaxID=3824 RepID=A0AAN9LZH0_CANGL
MSSLSLLIPSPGSGKVLSSPSTPKDEFEGLRSPDLLRVSLRFIGHILWLTSAQGYRRVEMHAPHASYVKVTLELDLRTINPNEPQAQWLEHPKITTMTLEKSENPFPVPATEITKISIEKL